MKSFLTLILSLFIFIGISQSTINNLDFEDSNFNNWTTITGTVAAPAGTPHPFVFSAFGIVGGSNYSQASHLIIDSQRNDPNVSLIKTLCPYTNSNSARLGDLNGGLEAVRLEKIISIDSAITNLDFFFAIVMQDPAHPLHEQPYIFLEVYDSSAGVLTLIDSIFILGGTSALTLDTSISGSWKYIDWNHQQFNLSPYSGKNILLRITNGDCGYGAHGGRMYLDFSMDPTRNYISTFLCSATDSISFRGNSYDSVGVYRDTVWSGSIIDSVFTLTIQGVIQNPTSAKLTNYNLCLSSTVFDMDCHVIGGTPGTFNYTWMVDGAIHQSGPNPHLTYTTTVNDTVFCVVTQIGGTCFVKYSDTLVVGPSVTSPIASLTAVGVNINTTVTGGKAPYSYSWKMNSSPLTSTNSSITPTANANYYVTVLDANGCSSQDSIIGYYLGIEELTSNFSFYPNPAKNAIYLELKGEMGVVEIIDIQGKIIQRNQIFSDKELNLENLDKGVYLLRFISEKGASVTRKLLIE
jgi:hypothetical protein